MTHFRPFCVEQFALLGVELTVERGSAVSQLIHWLTVLLSRRLDNYKTLCGVDDDVSVSDRCPSTSSPKLCRSAVIGLMGSELTANCTCVQRDPAKLARCFDVRRKLHQPNSCIGNDVHLCFSNNTNTWSRSLRYYYDYHTLTISLRSSCALCGMRIVRRNGNEYIRRYQMINISKTLTFDLLL